MKWVYLVNKYEDVSSMQYRHKMYSSVYKNYIYNDLIKVSHLNILEPQNSLESPVP